MVQGQVPCQFRPEYPLNRLISQAKASEQNNPPQQFPRARTRAGVALGENSH
jgi:hypothetical protein